MIPLSLAHLARACSGELSGITAAAAEQLIIDGPVVTDSRECGPGGLYVARIGEHADGHDYIPEALAAGAVAALTTRPVTGVACIVVPDIQDGFAELARGIVDAATDLTTIAITGSSGKTSTKDLLGQVLSAAGPTVAPQGSYNSEVGVPLTVARITPETRFLVAEMGSRGIGHIAYLTRIAPPDIAVVLNVGAAHLGEFGSREVIAEAKGELVEALGPDGTAVLNHDDPAVAAMATRTRAQVVTVSAAGDPGADIRAVDVTLDAASRPSFTITDGTSTWPVTLPLHGIHHVGNALAGFAAARAAGVAPEDIVTALADATPISRWRMEVTEHPDGVTVVNDAYNANPDSMRAALDALAVMGRGGRSIAVLGTMLELGPDSDAEHAATGRYAIDTGVDLLVCVGAAGEALAAWVGHLGERCRVVPHASAAYDLLMDELRCGDVVLFKSSRDAGLRHLGDRIAEAPPNSFPPDPATDPDDPEGVACSPS
ncbi:MAG TPA: UDP-N-acetylmuramoyl-tripeptide--D-alanyl-D-alanine ligase [Intrasporangiaceae bacterium]|nr:UDP-N-acetylmuramoyl-tripeptide--D-alanyl-D-alanine ligase [Intrasporangiaceae bacterium]